MSTDRKVVVKGGGKNLYKVSEYNGWFHVHKVVLGFLSNDNHSLGKTRSLADALDLIRSHSGREIQEVG